MGTDRMFDSAPARIVRQDVRVMLERTRDEPAAIARLWPRFEQLVGLTGRSRPEVEYYRRHREVELWVPILSS